jgi:hypothetical protein
MAEPAAQLMDPLGPGPYVWARSRASAAASQRRSAAAIAALRSASRLSNAAISSPERW